MIISLQNKPLGQINLGTERGQIIKDLASMPTVRTIVEIGTWNGYGSTQCVLEGIKDKKDCEFSTRAEWEILRDRTKFVFLDDTPLNGCHGYLLSLCIFELALYRFLFLPALDLLNFQFY